MFGGWQRSTDFAADSHDILVCVILVTDQYATECMYILYVNMMWELAWCDLSHSALWRLLYVLFDFQVFLPLCVFRYVWLQHINEFYLRPATLMRLHGIASVCLLVGSLVY